jgi:hypothetical protein
MAKGQAAYTRASYTNDLALGARVLNLEDQDRRYAVFPDGVELGTAFTDDCFAYLNRDGGWVYAEGGTRRALENVRALGGTVVGGKQSKISSRRTERPEGQPASDARTGRCILQNSSFSRLARGHHRLSPSQCANRSALLPGKFMHLPYPQRSVRPPPQTQCCNRPADS